MTRERSGDSRSFQGEETLVEGKGVENKDPDDQFIALKIESEKTTRAISEADDFNDLYKILRDKKEIQGNGKNWDAEGLINDIKQYFDESDGYSKQFLGETLRQYGNDELTDKVLKLKKLKK